jgi:hypothetical protein
VIGALFDVSLVAVAAFAVAAQLAAIPFIVIVRRRTSGGSALAGHPG